MSAETLAEAVICPLLMNGHAASMSTCDSAPADLMVAILRGSACIGSRCAWFVVARIETEDGPDFHRDSDGVPFGKCGVVLGTPPGLMRQVLCVVPGFSDPVRVAR